MQATSNYLGALPRCLFIVKNTSKVNHCSTVSFISGSFVSGKKRVVVLIIYDSNRVPDCRNFQWGSWAQRRGLDDNMYRMHLVYDTLYPDNHDARLLHIKYIDIVDNFTLSGAPWPLVVWPSSFSYYLYQTLPRWHDLFRRCQDLSLCKS